jgi:hypothetical protein
LDSDDEDDVIVTSSKAARPSTPDWIVDDDEEDEEEQDIHDDYKPTARDIFQENEEDEDFIADDDSENEDTLGVPTNENVDQPIMFTRWATAKPKELFQFAVEWLVQKKINPAFNKDKEIYDLTWKKLDDEVTGLAGSKFSSSVWNRDFTFALQARPQIDTVQTGSLLKDCHPRTLEDVEQDYDEEDSDEDPEDRETRDRHGNVIPPEDQVFALGSHCFSNANVAHTLKHWRYSLMEWVFDHLKQTGALAPERIVERDSWKVAKREKLVYEIVEQWKQKGTINMLYRSYKQQVDAARESKVCLS